MSDNDLSFADPFGQIADEFVEAFRQGKCPSVEEFARRYPAHDDEIREVLPALVLMEQAKSGDGACREPSGLPDVPGYRVLREIARGGMGRVLAAYDLALDRDVALKVLLPGANSDRFVRESRITARLPHPGIPPVHALGTLADSSPFLAMKLVAGQTLADEMKTADAPRLLQAFVQVCQAVGFAHSRGIIHRDLKPQNVMVGAFGEVQVMDWGLAKELEPASGGRQPPERIGGSDVPSQEANAPRSPREAAAEQTTDHRAAGESTGEQTQAGAVLGTPAYMAPEQARGEATDARADVFALGGILCAILTGHAPYVGRSSAELHRKAASGDLADATARLDNSEADQELIFLTKKCLSPEAIDRPRDAREVADRLAAYLDSVQERLQSAQRERAVAVAREAEQRKRRKVQLALAAALSGLLLVGGAFSWWRKEQAQAGRERDARNAEAVAALLGQCEGALKASDAAKAQVALDAARRRSDEGGAEGLAERLRRLGADLALLRDLDAVDQFRWTFVENKLPDKTLVLARTGAALARFGIDFDAVSADAAAVRVSTSLMKERIVAALDRLLWPGNVAAARAVLRLVDANPFRDAFRDAILASEQARFVELASQDEALEQPPGFAAFLGDIGDIEAERRRQLLEGAVSRRPGDLSLLMTLGNMYPIDQEVGAKEQVRWFQAAVAAAPTCPAAHNNLGVALFHRGQPVKTIVYCRKAIELDPMFAMAYVGLANALVTLDQLDEAMASCRKAIEIDSKLVGAYNNLAAALIRKGQLDEAIANLRTALEIDPKSPLIQMNLGIVLHRNRQLDGAIECFRKAIDLDPKLATAHTNLGTALDSKGQPDRAIECFRKAILVDPKLALAHCNLGLALRTKGQLDEAAACFRKLVQLTPSDAMAHLNLGNVLDDKGLVDDGIACYQKAIDLDPKFAQSHYNLGHSLYRKGQLDKAIACWRETIKLDPNYPEAHCNLGHALAGQGRFIEALAAQRRGHELGSKQDGWRYPSRQWVRQAERNAALEAKLPALLEGKFRPRDNNERQTLIAVCQAKKLHRTATDLWTAVFAADPKLATDLVASHRYNAACCACLAAAGQGEDADKIDDKERARLRKQALDWLRADLALHTKLSDKGSQAVRSFVEQKMRHLQQDSDLAGIRGAEALARLPAEQRATFTQLWSDVAALLKKVETPAKKENK
jgi:tetratricopeptide (TPR) repeat protein